MLNKNSHADKILFLIHDGAGRVEGYFKFTKLIHRDFITYGITIDEMIGYVPQNITIQDIAKKYIVQIKKTQPSGPYFIAGWSIGGTIAFEITNQLEKEENDVAFCALFDTPPPGYYSPNQVKNFTVDSEINFISKFIKDESLKSDLKKSSDIHQFWNCIKDNLKSGDFDKELFISSVNPSWFKIIPNFDYISLVDLFYLTNIIRTLHNARVFYNPDRRVKTPVHLFNAIGSTISNMKDWNNYCYSSITYQVNGEHYSILNTQNVKAFSEQFNKALDNIH